MHDLSVCCTRLFKWAVDGVHQICSKRWWIIFFANRMIHINWLSVKLFQSIAEKYQWLGPDVVNMLKNMTDSVPWSEDDFPEDIVSNIWELRNKFCIFFDEKHHRHNTRLKPINSGMVSLVFKAKDHRTDKPLIIKIKRRNIKEKINSSIHSLRSFVYWLDYFGGYFFSSADIYRTIDQLESVMKIQLDFQNEVNNLNLLHTKFSESPTQSIIVPQAYGEVTEYFPDIIAMEYIDGVPIDFVQEELKSSYSNILINFGLTSILTHGIVHGDLHSGNMIFVNQEDKLSIGIIDVGVLHTLSPSTVKILNELFTGIMVLNMHEFDIIKLIVQSDLIHGDLEHIDLGPLVSLLYQLKTSRANWTTAHFIQWINKFIICTHKLSCCTDELIRLYGFIWMSHGITNYLCDGAIENALLKAIKQ